MDNITIDAFNNELIKIAKEPSKKELIRLMGIDAKNTLIIKGKVPEGVGAFALKSNLITRSAYKSAKKFLTKKELKEFYKKIPKKELDAITSGKSIITFPKKKFFSRNKMNPFYLSHELGHIKSSIPSLTLSNKTYNTLGAAAFLLPKKISKPIAVASAVNATLKGISETDASIRGLAAMKRGGYSIKKYIKPAIMNSLFQSVDAFTPASAYFWKHNVLPGVLSAVKKAM